MSKSKLCHRRLGHVSIKKLKQLQNSNLVSGFSLLRTTNLEICKSCLEGKHHMSKFPKEGGQKAIEPLEIGHYDICGPMKVMLLGGALYFDTFIDDFSRKTIVNFLRFKNQNFEKFKKFKALAKKQTRKLFKIFRFDNGGEYTSLEFNKYYKENGIARQLTISYNPEQNGIYERKNKTLQESVLNML
jgi:hypothetical protein